MNRDCRSCTHYRYGEIRMREPDVQRSCAAGHGEAMAEWWLRNGEKYPGESIDGMPCHEPNGVIVALDNCIKAVEKALEYVSKKEVT